MHRHLAGLAAPLFLGLDRDDELGRGVAQRAGGVQDRRAAARAVTEEQLRRSRAAPAGHAIGEPGQEGAAHDALALARIVRRRARAAADQAAQLQSGARDRTAPVGERIDPVEHV
jgi:hypothetical protein